MASTKIATSLTELPNSLQEFSSALIAIEGVDVFDKSVHSAKELNELRKNIRKDIIHYGTDTLPECIKFVEHLEKFYEKFAKLSFEDWRSKLSKIIRNAEKLEKECKDVYRQHVALSGNLKSEKLTAESLQNKLKRVNLEQEEDQRQLQKSATTNKVLAVGVGLTVIGLPFAIMFAGEGFSNESEASALRTKMQFNADAIQVLQKKLIPALKKIIDCLMSSSQCLNEIVRLLRKLSSVECDSDNSDDSDEDEDEDELRAEHTSMTSCVQDINVACRQLYSVAPHVESDLLALASKN